MATKHNPDRLRVAAISFLNPAPLLWDFEHEPGASRLRARYDVQYTQPSLCAAQLAHGEADLGLIPIAALATAPELAVVPGCTIASCKRVRSIQLVLRPGLHLHTIRSIAADAASRSSAAYVRILLQRLCGHTAPLIEHHADLPVMLGRHDAALLIGDPALLALEARDTAGSFADCTWIDVAELWHMHTGLPWVAAVWAVRPDALQRCSLGRAELLQDLLASRDAGLEHTEELVAEWQPRTRLPATRIREYLTCNIHYQLDEECLRAIRMFFSLAEQTGVLPPYCLSML